jgi:predicted small lipoprotein YifL
MKKLNLLLIPVLFSSLLIGCGMKGPLYRAPETQTIEKQPTTPEKKIEEQKNETIELTSNVSQ